MGKWVEKPLGSLIIEEKKSPVQVQGASNFGEYPFFTSGDKVLIHNKYLVEGEKLFLATGGKANIKYYNGKAAYSTDTYVISSGKECTLYIFYFLLNQIGYINSNLFTGSGLKHLQKNDFKKFLILLPEEKSEQTRIAQILSKADAAIAQTDALISKYQRIKTGLMQDLLTKGIDEHGNIRSKQTHRFVIKNGIEVPEEWEVEPLSKAMEIIDCKHVTPKYVEEGIALLRPRNIKPGGISFEDIAYVTELDFNFLMDKHKPQEGDIVFTRNASFGVSSFIESFTKFAIGQDVVIMTKKGDVNPHFIFLLLNSVLLTQIMNQSAGSTFGRINLGIIRKLKTVLPPPTEQNRISKCINQLESFLTVLGEKMNKLQSLKTGLMQDLLSGKVRVKVKENEMA